MNCPKCGHGMDLVPTLGNWVVNQCRNCEYEELATESEMSGVAMSPCCQAGVVDGKCIWCGVVVSTCDEDTQPIIVDEVDTLLLDDVTGEG